jgi:hypothetical protein
VRYEFIKYKTLIEVPEIQDMCDLAIKLEDAKRRVQRSINRGFLESQTFQRLDSLTLEFIHSLANVIRKFVPEAKKEDIEIIIKDMESMITFGEYDKRRLFEELREQPRNFPAISTYLTIVDKFLYSYFLNVLRNIARIRDTRIARDFVLNVYRLRGLTPSPVMMKELKREEEEEI